jgi:hypothetical protein
MQVVSDYNKNNKKRVQILVEEIESIRVEISEAEL